MGHSDIGVTLNTYTHLGLEDATDELRRMEELENARKELEKKEKCKKDWDGRNPKHLLPHPYSIGIYIIARKSQSYSGGWV